MNRRPRLPPVWLGSSWRATPNAHNAQTRSHHSWGVQPRTRTCPIAAAIRYDSGASGRCPQPSQKPHTSDAAEAAVCPGVRTTDIHPQHTRRVRAPEQRRARPLGPLHARVLMTTANTRSRSHGSRERASERTRRVHAVGSSQRRCCVSTWGPGRWGTSCRWLVSVSESEFGEGHEGRVFVEARARQDGKLEHAPLRIHRERNECQGERQHVGVGSSIASGLGASTP